LLHFCEGAPEVQQVENWNKTGLHPVLSSTATLGGLSSNLSYHRKNKTGTCVTLLLSVLL
jgi:hypothetical protein